MWVKHYYVGQIFCAFCFTKCAVVKHAFYLMHAPNVLCPCARTNIQCISACAHTVQAYIRIFRMQAVKLVLVHALHTQTYVYYVCW
jgi:hypothetical protein